MAITSKTPRKKAPAKAPRKAAAKTSTAKKSGTAAKKAPAKSSSRRKAAAANSGQSGLSIFGVAPYKMKKGEEYMSDEQLAHFTNILESWKASLMQEVDRTIDHLRDETINFPDSNDRATLETEFGIELKTRDRERKLIRKINAALERINQGTYGYCEKTGEEIGLARLEARPIATMCVEAQERYEKAERHFGD
ncbi:MAG: RNA polymerase-binding protein DksA [Pseudomonadota bacterium]